MYTRRNEWEEDKEFTADKVISMVLKKYNRLLTSERWYNKDTNDAQTLSLVWVSQKLGDDSKK